MPAKKPSVGKIFASAGVGESGQVLQLKDRVSELEAEVLRLRANPSANLDLERQVQVLTEQLQGREGEHEILISLIDPDPNQPRRTITDAMQVSRAESLRQYGQLQPIIVIPQANGRYKLFEGELRWRAAKLVPMTTLRAVFLRQERDAATTFRGQLLTRLHNEDLHDLDLAEALIQDIRYQVSDWSDDRDITQALDEGIRHLRKLNRLQELGQLKQQPRQAQQEWIESIEFPNPGVASILSILLDLHLNPSSVCSNIFPLLFVPEDVKQAMRTSGLDSSKARVIAGVKDRDLRQQILQEAVEQNLPVRSIRDRAAELKQVVVAEQADSTEPTLRSQFDQTYRQIKQSKQIWNDPKKAKKMEKLLSELKKMLEDEQP